MIKDQMNGVKHRVDDVSTAIGQQNKHDILEWLSPSQHIDFSQQQAVLIDERAKNTGRGLIESKKFRQWRDGKQGSIILKGGGGMGKTMLASTAIEHLTTLTTLRSDGSAIAYFFGNWAHADKFSAQTLLASLLKQLLSTTDIKLPEKLKELYSFGTHPTYSQLCRLFQLVVGSLAKTFIIVDALNELDEDTQDKLLKTLSELQTSVAINLMVTSRDPRRTVQYIPSAEEINIRASKEDLNLWMDESLGKLPPGCFISKSSPETHQKIKATLAEAADGM